MPRNPVAPVRKTGFFTPPTSSRSGTIWVPIAWKPPSDVVISAVMGPRAGAEQEVDRPRATGAGSLDVPAESGACFSQAVARSPKPGDATRGQRRSGPADTRFTRTRGGPRSRARYRAVASRAAFATPIQS
jgi:hypothetical protein